MSNLMRRMLVSALAGLMVFLLSAPVLAADLRLQQNARVAVVGDSITEQKLYSLYIELYLTACQPQLNTTVCQWGWGGERAEGFARRMDHDLFPYKPDVVTTCYGMNDGQYRPYEASIGDYYEKHMRQIVSALKARSATVIVGGPGVVDTRYFRPRPGFSADGYNQNLGELNKIARRIAEDNGMPHADVHAAMLWAMEKGKAALGEEYAVGGRDGVHPGKNGHLVMAYAFLKAMGFDGNLGTIVVDMNGQSSADGGHKVLSSEGGRIEVESTRYPFCFTGNDQDDNQTKSILPFVPFNRELNRLTLKVRNAESERVNVTWGKESREFSRAELEERINLAEAFVPNPFNPHFAKVESMARDKENFETQMIKHTITRFAWLKNEFKEDTDVSRSLDNIQERLWAKQQERANDVKAAVVPVKHTIVIEAAKEEETSD